MATDLKERPVEDPVEDPHSDKLNPGNNWGGSSNDDPQEDGGNSSSEGDSSDGTNSDPANNGSPKKEKPAAEKDPASIAEKEANAANGDGNASAVNGKEKSFKSIYANEKANVSGKLKKRLAIGGAVGVTLASMAIVMFLPGIFMKAISERITDTFMGRVNYAVEQRIDRMVNHYVLNKIGGTSNTCTGPITRDCVNLDPNDKSIFSLVAANWKQNRIETKLFEKHGIEFKKSTLGDGRVKVFQNGKDLGDFGPRVLTEKVSGLIQTDSRSKGVLMRMQMRQVAQNKYGAAKWCFIACSKRDAFSEAVTTRKQRIKLGLVSQVSRFRIERLTAYMMCKMASCNFDELTKSDNDAVKRVLAKVDDEVLKEVLDDFNRYETRSISQMLIQRTVDRIVSTIVGPTAGKAAASAVPVAGQVYGILMLAELVASLDDAIEGKELSGLAAKINEQEAILYYTSLESVMEDVESGQADIQDSWAAFDLVKGAGKSKLYSDLTGKDNLPALKCNDGKVVTSSDPRLVCPELTVKHSFLIEDIRNDPLVSQILDFTNIYEWCFIPETAATPCGSPRSVVKRTLKFINAGIGFVGDGAMQVSIDLIRFIGGGFVVDKTQELFSTQVYKGIEWMTKEVIPMSIDAGAEDDRAVDQFAMGADGLANSLGRGDYSTLDMPNMGFKELTPAEQVSIDTKIAEKKREDFKSKSFFARYLDLNNSDSLASLTSYKTALLLSEPVETVRNIPSSSLNSFAGLFNTNKASATLSVPRESLFGISQYGPDEALLDIDPSELTPEKCEEYREARIASEFINEDTGQVEYALADPCETERVVYHALTATSNIVPENSGSGPVGSTITYPGLDGPSIPCEGEPSRNVVRALGPNSSPKADWTGIPTKGSIGTSKSGLPINVYVREACLGATNVKTVLIASSIHGSENGGQLVAHELLYKRALPSNIRLIVIPEINQDGLNLSGTGIPRVNANEVNLNRNFNYKWAAGSKGGDNNFGGVAPESEAETKALVNFVNAIGKIDLSIHYHDDIDWVAAAVNTNVALAQTYASTGAVPLRSAESGTVQQGGSFDGWLNSSLGVPSLLVEMGPTQDDPKINQHVESVLKILNQGGF
jgi:hypothetical protein